MWREGSGVPDDGSAKAIEHSNFPLLRPNASRHGNIQRITPSHSLTIDTRRDTILSPLKCFFLVAIPSFASVCPGLKPFTLRQMTDVTGVTSHRARVNPERCHGTLAATRTARARIFLGRHSSAEMVLPVGGGVIMTASPHAPLGCPQPAVILHDGGPTIPPVITQSMC